MICMAVAQATKITCGAATDSSTVPRYILVRENMPVRGLGVDSTRPFPSYNASDWGRVRRCYQSGQVSQRIVSPADSVPPRHYPLADSVPFNYFAADSVPHVKVKNKGSSLSFERKYIYIKTITLDFASKV